MTSKTIPPQMGRGPLNTISRLVYFAGLPFALVMDHSQVCLGETSKPRSAPKAVEVSGAAGHDGVSRYVRFKPCVPSGCFTMTLTRTSETVKSLLL